MVDFTGDEIPFEGVWLYGMQSTPLLLLLPGPLWFKEVEPDRVLSIGQIEVWHLNWVQVNDLC